MGRSLSRCAQPKSAGVIIAAISGAVLGFAKRVLDPTLGYLVLAVDAHLRVCRCEATEGVSAPY